MGSTLVTGIYWMLLAAAALAAATLAVAFPPTPIIVSPAASVLTAPDFCSRSASSTSRNSCPAPPTPTDLDLNTLLGSYYEIGSTARYKLRNELGTACTHTNFTLATVSSHSTAATSGAASYAAGALVDIPSSGIHVVSAPRILSVLSRMASSAARVCSGAARLCGLMAPQSRLSYASTRLSAAFDELAPSNPAAANAIAEASAALNASVVGVHARLDRLSHLVSFAAATVATALDQGLAAEVALRGVRGAAGTGSAEARDLASAVVYNLTAVGAFVEGVLERIPAGDLTNARQLLQEAAALIDAEIDDAISQVLGVQEQLMTLGGPLVEMAAADYRSGLLARMLGGGRAPGSRDRVVVRTARAEIAGINATDEVAADGEADTETTPEASTTNIVDTTAATAPSSPLSAAATEPAAEVLHIIAAEGGGGIGVGEYEAVLVYSCSRQGDGDDEDTLSKDLVLLARTPYLPPATVIRLLRTAASYGIFTDCDNPFVPTLQRPEVCASLRP